MAESQPDTGNTDTPEPDQNDQATPDTGKDLAAEVEKWKQQARKHEDRAKANAAAAKELDQLRQQSMSDQEKAVAEAVAAARIEERTKAGARLVDAEVRAATAGRIDADALLDGLDRGRFLGDDGEPDTDAIAAWVDRIIPPQPEPDTPFGDLGQGTRIGAADGMALNGDPLLRDLKQKLGIR